MKDIMIQEVKFPTSFNSFKQLVQSMVPVDAWLDESPEDINEWEVEYELTDYHSGVAYRCWLRYYNIDDDFIINAFIEEL